MGAVEQWDVAVVGAGPAGSTAALAALRTRPAARVLLLDRADFPRDKSCGDGIAPHALDVLAGLGVHGLVDDHRPVRRLSLGYPTGTGPAVEGVMRRPARVVPRAVLDARLRDAAVRAGAVPLRHRVREVDVREDGVVLDGAHHADVVVAADGAHSALRRVAGLAPAASPHLALALRGYAPVVPRLADEQRIVLAADGGSQAYAWSFPVGDGRANIGYGEVLGDGPPPTRQHLLDRLDDLLPGSAVGARDWRGHHLPLSSGRPRQPDGRLLLAGDALSLVNPLTGEGIYYAVLSGALAGVAGARATGAGGRSPRAGGADGGGAGAGAAYRRALARELGRHLRHTTAAAVLTRHLPVMAAGVRAASGRPELFDDLVELGLGRGLLRPRVLLATARSLVAPRPPGRP